VTRSRRTARGLHPTEAAMVVSYRDDQCRCQTDHNSETTLSQA
jgi:hypothetical protein